MYVYVYVISDQSSSSSSKRGRVGACSPCLVGELGRYFTTLVHHPSRVAPTPYPHSIILRRRLERATLLQVLSPIGTACCTEKAPNYEPTLGPPKVGSSFVPLLTYCQGCMQLKSMTPAWGTSHLRSSKAVILFRSQLKSMTPAWGTSHLRSSKAVIPFRSQLKSMTPAWGTSHLRSKRP